MTAKIYFTVSCKGINKSELFMPFPITLLFSKG